MFLLFPDFKDYSASLGESLLMAVVAQLAMKTFGLSYEFIPHMILVVCIGYIAGLTFGTILTRILSGYFDRG